MPDLRLSAPGTRFVSLHEGFVSKAYRCPAGVVTIGYGFTMRSAVFAAYWISTRGHALRMGETMTREEGDRLLPKVFDEEYGAAVNAKIRTTVQHEYDGAGSVAFNCGTGALKWRWAQALAAGDVARAAALLRTTATTANGRKLAGLVRRRKEEAALIETGRYGEQRIGASPARSETVAEILEYQEQLKALGYDVGVPDGIVGPKTVAAVRAFQTTAGLKVDGAVGPATRAALIRALDTKRGGQAAGGAGGAAGAGGGALELPDAAQQAGDLASQSTDVLLSALMWGTIAVLVVGVVVLALKYRGVLTGRRVPT